MNWATRYSMARRCCARPVSPPSPRAYIIGDNTLAENAGRGVALSVEAEDIGSNAVEHRDERFEVESVSALKPS